MLSPAKPPGADDSQLADRLLSADARGLHGNNTAGGGDDIEGNGGGASPLPSPEQLQGLRRYGLLNGIQVPVSPLFRPLFSPYLGPYLLNGIQVPFPRPLFSLCLGPCLGFYLGPYLGLYQPLPMPASYLTSI